LSPAGDTVDAFIAAIEAKDLDTAMGLVAEDCEYDNVPMGKVFGRADIRATLARAVDRSDEIDWIVHRQVAADGLVLNERVDRFKMGKTWVEIPVAGVFEVIDGAITLWRDYFDLASYRDQMP
jgi:limonene-1,2-epoxide hydrolase